MSFIIGTIWGILSALVLYITTKYYLPKMLQNSNGKLSVNPCIDDKKLMNKAIAIVVIIIFSAICGYFTAENSTSVINMLRIAVAFYVLLLSAQTDYRYMIIPNLCSEMLLISGIISIILEFIFNKENALAWLLNCLISAIVTLIVLLLLNRLTRGGIGMGDVKIFSSLSFLCGLRCVFATLMLAFLLCALVSLFLIILKKRTVKDVLPLGPFIYFGFGISIILAII